MPLVLILAAAFVIGLVLAARKTSVTVGAEDAQASAADVAIATVEHFVMSLDELYQKHADAFGVDWRLVKAIAQHESHENPDAVNPRDNESIGIMQILCRPDGQGGCLNKLNVEGWNETTRVKLFDADWNVYIGTQILADNIDRYGVAKGIAVYNAWDQHVAPTAGPFKNQAYVNDVLKRATALGWSA
jgi:soluble lytic murein transglycosylase-like protein